MDNKEVRVGQVRRWNGLHHQHIALGLVFRVEKINDHNWVDARYLRRGEHAAVVKETLAEVTSSDVEFMRTKSEVVEEDADLYVTVNVTKRDIKEGKCGNARTCAVALAASRAIRKRFRRWRNVTVSQAIYKGFVLRDEQGRDMAEVFRYDVTDSVAKWIVAFDNHHDKTSDLEPISFQIPIPAKFVGRQRRS